MSFEEAALISAMEYGMNFSYDGNDDSWFICPECGEPIVMGDYPAYDFSECPICGFKFLEGE